jgi:hypothetical protein
MSKFEIKDGIDKILYRTYNLYADFRFHLTPSVKKILKNNLPYRNKHKGGRCFILGTAPSLNLLTSSQVEALSQEVVFGVNSLYKVEVVSAISPKYYVLLDNLYWEQWSHTFTEVATKYKKDPPTFITDLRAKNIADLASPNRKHICIHARKYPVVQMSEELDKNIYGAMNVMSFSILAAMYMGFKEIYLLGCDYNAFCASGRGHAYDDESELKEVKYNLAFYLRFYWITTEFHYLIANLAKKKSISVINLTPNSLLDAYPKMQSESVLSTTSNGHVRDSI